MRASSSNSQILGMEFSIPFPVPELLKVISAHACLTTMTTPSIQTTLTTLTSFTTLPTLPTLNTLIALTTQTTLTDWQPFFGENTKIGKK